MRPNYSDYQLLFGDFTKIPESGFDRWMIRSIGEINRYLCCPLEEIEEEDKNLCIFRAIDSVKELIRKMGLTNELKEEFDKYLFNMLSFVKKRVVSIPKFMNMCKQKLSESQYKMIENAHNANSMLLGLVDSLKEHKQYGKLKIKPI